MPEDRAQVEQAMIDVYASRQNRDILQWRVAGVEDYAAGPDNKVPCLVVMKNGVKGIIPFTESGIEFRENISRYMIKRLLSNLISQDVNFIVTQIDKEESMFIGSIKDARQKLELTTGPHLKENAMVKAVARRIVRRPREDGSLADMGVEVEIDGVDAFLPITEISYGWVNEIVDVIQPGDPLQVRILTIDRETKRIVVSLKAVIKNPWPDAAPLKRKQEPLSLALYS